MEGTTCATFASSEAMQRASTWDAPAVDYTTSSAAGRGASNSYEPPNLSFTQRRLWFMHRLDRSGSIAYQSTISLVLCGPLDRSALRAALDALVRRHALLRAAFPAESGQPAQIVGPPETLVALTEQARNSDATLEDIVERELHEPLDLATGPLFRGRLVCRSQNEHILLITMHDMISDRRSFGIVVGELGRLYAAFRDGRDDPLPAREMTYAEYADRERACFDDEHSRFSLAFWTSYLAGAPEILQLPANIPRPEIQSSTAARVPFRLSSDLVRQLLEFSDRHAVDLFTTLMSGWACLLGRWSGQDEVVIGTTVPNRECSETIELLGPLENMVAVRVKIHETIAVVELIAHVRNQIGDALEHRTTPFAAVIDALQPTRSLTYRPVVQATLEIRDAFPCEVVSFPGVAASVSEPLRARTGFDVSLWLTHSDDGMSGVLEFASEVFDRPSIVRLVPQFQKLLGEMILDDRQILGSVPLTSDAELQQLLIHFNGLEEAYAGEGLIQKLFEEQVLARADSTAVVCGTKRLSYAKLNSRANQLAHRLMGLGVRPDDRVAIFVERGLDMIVGLLGILKSGGAYVPMDFDHPTDRLAYLLNDSAPIALVTQTHLRGKLPRQELPVVLLDEAGSGTGLAHESELNPEIVGLDARHLAYVIYTSGSTGDPKGVLNQHNAATLRVRWALNQYGLTCEDRVLQKTPLGCDFSVWEIFLPLSVGSLLVMARPGGHQDARYLIDEIECRGVTTLFFVPSMLQMFVDELSPGNCAAVRRVLSSGEALPGSLQTQFFLKLPHCELWNLYGPTEGTIDVTCWRCDPDRYESSVPMGRPIENAKIYILDRYNHPVSVGVAGEIHIGGSGVARGYLHRPQLTAERFVCDPFSSDSQGRMYKTGDLGRWRPDGNIEYLGRNDFQVKIRGFRVEPGEVEAHLLKCTGVRDAVVIVREDQEGDRRLVAYLTSRDEEKLSCAKLRSALAARLPSHMIPNAYVVLDKLPLNTNGKLDRSALTAPDDSSVVIREYEPPHGDIEQALAKTWQGMLGLERVGRQDNFFELGGHSLLGMKLLAGLAEQFSVRFPVSAIFQYPTLEGLASLIQKLLTEPGAGGGLKSRKATPHSCAVVPSGQPITTDHVAS